MAYITVFDTTLRDGEQSPGFSMNIDEKLQLAHQLASLNVDVIEAGFPVASEGDFKAVNAIAKKIKGPVICGLARMLEADIRSAAKALKPAQKKRIHVFISTSDIHIKHQLKKTPRQVIEMTRKGVRLAKRFTKDVEFSCMDATRSEPKFLYEIIAEAIEAGATTVNIPDTVGYAIPKEFGRLISGIVDNVPNVNEAVLSVHCHNDLGLAVANSLTAIEHGVRQVECTINGIGERAGNSSLEEVVMALKIRRDLFSHKTRIKTREIHKTSKMLTAITGVSVQPNKAIVGENAFAHESGIHQDGVIKRRETYEIMTPQSIGLKKSRIVLGKHSGRNAFGKRMAELGFKLDSARLNAAFESFKRLADRKKEVFEEDLEALVGDEIAKQRQTWELVYFHTATGSRTVPTATVKLKHDSNVIMESATGDGPIDAIYNAIDRITRIKGKLISYGVRAATENKDAVGEVTVHVKFRNRPRVRGRNSSTDTIEASARAYLNALNRALAEKGD
jgi:2-isopropylmalate synthase